MDEVDAHGTRPPLVMVHGWGMGPEILSGIDAAFSSSYRIESLALPGHGNAPAVPGWTAAGLAREWLEARPDALWLGWSLGALVALAAAAQAPERVKGLVLVGATPCFRAAADWPLGMDRAQFASFRDRCADDPGGTLRRFLALQMHGDNRAREGLRVLRAHLAAGPMPDAAALGEGLRVLADTDLRPRLPELHCPTVWISGEADAVTPPAAAQAAARRQVRARVSVVAGAGHVPFITHERPFMSLARAALSELTA